MSGTSIIAKIFTSLNGNECYTSKQEDSDCEVIICFHTKFKLESVLDKSRVT